MPQLRREELNLLIRRHAASLELFARQYGSYSEDCVQDAFLQLIQQPKLPENPVAWLYRVIRNRAISVQRSGQRRQQREVAFSAQSESFVSDPSATLEASEATERLEELELELREVVVAKIWGGLTFIEIAELLDISSSTAHRRYLEGLTWLKKKLTTDDPTGETRVKMEPRSP